MVLRNDTKKSGTNSQLVVASWLHEMGLGFTMEEEFSPYFADIYIKDLNLTIELDGPSHLNKRDAKRDAVLKDKYNLDVWRFSNETIKGAFKEQFIAEILERAEEVDDA